MRNRSLRILSIVLACGGLAAAHGAALGADLEAYTPYKTYDPIGPGPDLLPWSGWQVGALLGYGYADTSFAVGGSELLADGTDLTASGFSYGADGILGGVMVGWNWQYGDFVFGAEGDWVGSNLTASQKFGDNTVDASVDWMAGVRGRAGVLVAPDLLLFGTIGYGWAGIDLPVAGPYGGPGSDTFSGWQFGGGGEYRFTENWSARLDYLYTDLDAQTLNYSDTSVTYDPDIHTVRGALVFKF